MTYLLTYKRNRRR